MHTDNVIQNENLVITTTQKPNPLGKQQSNRIIERKKKRILRCRKCTATATIKLGISRL